ncbi:MAG: nucleotide exchange factor GrpE [Anaerolineales bacterium]
MNDKKEENEKQDAVGEEAQAIKEQMPESQASGADGKKELIALQEKLAELQSKADENLDGWQRAQAEFANYRKRMARDQEQFSAEARGRVIKRYLEIVDDLELALKKLPQEGAGADWAKGIDLIYRKLQSFLDSEGLTRIDPLGEPFDANLHEAVTQERSDEHESGTVIEVLRPGYMLADRVLRPASVKVAK